MKLFNTKTRKTEQLQAPGGQVTLYVAGQRPEEEWQISQLFLFCMLDVLVRYLELTGLRVNYGYIVDNGLSEDQSPLEAWPENFAETLRLLNVRLPDNSSEPATVRPEDTIDILVTGHDSSDAASTGNQLPPARLELRTAAVTQAEPITAETLAGPMSVKEMLQRYSSDALRIYLAQHHYRSPWAHDQIRLDKAAQHAEKLSAAMTAKSTGQRRLNTTPVRRRFEAALDNDLDTVKAIATLLNLADEILFRAPNDYLIDDGQMALRQMAAVFGLRLD